MPTVISSLEELQQSAEVQSALKFILPRIHGYLEASCLLPVARDPNMSPEQKGYYLEAYNDVRAAMDALYLGLDVTKTTPSPRRARLNNSILKDPS